MKYLVCFVKKDGDTGSLFVDGSEKDVFLLQRAFFPDEKIFYPDGEEIGRDKYSSVSITPITPGPNET